MCKRAGRVAFQLGICALGTCSGTSNLDSLTPFILSQEMFLSTSRFDLHYKKNSCWVRKIQAYIYKYSRERIPSITTQFVEIYDWTTFLSDQLTSLSPDVYCWNISLPIFDWSRKYFFANIWLILKIFLCGYLIDLDENFLFTAELNFTQVCCTTIDGFQEREKINRSRIKIWFSTSSQKLSLCSNTITIKLWYSVSFSS